MNHEFQDVSVDCVIFGFNEKSLQVLLIEQEEIEPGIPPFKALPGDLVYDDEDLDDAASRVLKELTGLSGVYLKQFKAFGNPNRVRDLKDQLWLRKFRTRPEARVITIAYYSLINMEEYSLQPASFAKKAEWIPLDKVPKLAFDHNEILEASLTHLREETLKNNISFELLPKKFTLAQLQNLYEVILDRTLDKRNFRKSIKKLEELVPLNEKQKGVYHKPAQLFSFRKTNGYQHN